MQKDGKIEDSGLSPSFSCYFSDSSTTSVAAAKVIREEHAARFRKFGEIEGEDFEFSYLLSDEETSSNAIFPVFDRDFLVNDDEIKSKDNEIDASASITGQLRRLFIEGREESSSCSSSEADELENLLPGTFCVWKPKSNGGSSPSITKCKKSSSTGSGSKRWGIRYLLRRSNSEGKKPEMLLAPKKVDSPKQKRNSGEVSKVAGKFKAQTPVHEQFYVQRRAEKEVGKRKSYLPYRRDLVGFF